MRRPAINQENRMAPHDTYVTTSFRTLGYAGALLFTICPPAFIYESYLIFYTTAVEENASVGLFASGALLLSFASIPMMLVGRRKRHSLAPSLAELQPGAL
jgi:hypothetical protein